jgi:hypothetical protein
MTRRVSFFLLAVFAVAAPAAAQQMQGIANFPRVGVMAGLSSATLHGDLGGEADRRNAGVIGLYLVEPLGRFVSIRPELLYSQKGASSTQQDDTGEEPGREAVKFSYLDIPILLQFERKTASGLRPHLFIGPSLDLQIGCAIEMSQGPASAIAKCDAIGLHTKAIEMAAVVGAGIGFPVATKLATLGLRFQRGFTDASKLAKVQNRVLALYGSVEFGR